MKRRWGVQRFLDRCDFLRDSLDRPAITTDVIVGFPGETEADFESTLDTCRSAGFSKIHMFPFSARKGTPAAEMQDALPKSVKSERGKRLGQLELELRDQYFESLKGMSLKMLVEGKSDAGVSSGTSCRYATVELHDQSPQIGQLVDVRIDRTDDGILHGTAS